MKQFFLIILLTGAALAAFSQEGANTGIVYGKNHVFSITAPKGWILDNQAGVSEGLHAVFYPVGGSWQKSIAVMYASTGSLTDGEFKTLDDLITKDTLTFRQASKTMFIGLKDSIIIDAENKVAARVIAFEKDDYGNYERVAYIQHPKFVAMMILTSRTKEDYEKNLDAFAALVRSYIFLADDIKLIKKD